MFLDLKFEGRGPEPTCKACSGPFGFADQVIRIRFQQPHRHGLDALNGVYHESCAKPLNALIDAYTLLGRLG